MKLAAIQMRSGTDAAENVAAASALIREAASAGAAFVATPEMTVLVQSDRMALLAGLHAQDDDPSVAAFAALAAELGIHLLIGSMAIKADDRAGNRAANRSLLFDPSGRVTARYDKIHLFDADISSAETWRESRTYAAGDASVTAKAGPLTLGLSVCYDLRFPGLYRDYAACGADVMCVPSAFTVPTGRAHWEVLLRARAIESGAYVVAPAQGGTHADGRQTWGHTMIVGPWGEVLAEVDDDAPGVICADYDAGAVARARAAITAWRQV